MVENKFKISADNKENIARLSGSKIAVLGAARSGLAVTRLLHAHGAKILVSDIKPVDSAIKKAMKSMPEIEYEFGEHTSKILESDMICISPGIPLTIPILQESHKLSIPIAGELEIASWFNRAPVCAITGSNGKTTTTALTGNIFRSHFQRVIVGGNIGNPLADEIQKLPDPQVCVLEVSSFQLETIVNFHPEIAVIMNLSVNHLDRYRDFGAYVAAKMNILKNLGKKDILIYNADDLLLVEEVLRFPGIKVPFSLRQKLGYGGYWDEDQIRVDLDRKYDIAPTGFALKGPHNRYNMIAASLLAVLKGVPEEIIKSELENFPGIPHRLEEVTSISGVTYVNDSKATTVSSLNYALQSFEQPIILIAGGIDKGGDFSELNILLKKKVRAAVLIGRAAQQMRESWNSIVPIHSAETLEDAVYTSQNLAEKGDVVLLSPACSSFDMFNDYEDRGSQFKKIVLGLKKQQGSKIRVN